MHGVAAQLNPVQENSVSKQSQRIRCTLPAGDNLCVCVCVQHCFVSKLRAALCAARCFRTTCSRSSSSSSNRSSTSNQGVAVVEVLLLIPTRLKFLLPPCLHTICFGPSIDAMQATRASSSGDTPEGAGAAEHVAITAGSKKEEAGELALSLPHVSVASASRRLRRATVDSA